LLSLTGLRGELERLDRIVLALARLVRDRAVAVAVDVAVDVASAENVPTVLSDRVAGGPGEQALARLVPQNDPVGGVHGEHRFPASRDPFEGFVESSHRASSPGSFPRRNTRPFSVSGNDAIALFDPSASETGRAFVTAHEGTASRATVTRNSGDYAGGERQLADVR